MPNYLKDTITAPISPDNVEAALDNHNLFARMRGDGRYWQVRRNGRTQRWATRPGHFRIPIRYGLKGTGQITHDLFPMSGTPDFAHRDDIIQK